MSAASTKGRRRMLNSVAGRYSTANYYKIVQPKTKENISEEKFKKKMWLARENRNCVAC